MANQNIINAKGIPLEASNSRGGFHADPGPYIGVVMDNKDATRTGRLRVWLRTHSAEDRNDESHWCIVRYTSPFYGTTPHNLEGTTDSNFENNGHAYGMWMTPPDLGVEVLCFFVEGDPNKGYYLGCIPEPQMNHMLPGTGSKSNPDGVIFNNEKQEKAFQKATKLPTIEMDRTDEGMRDSKFVDRARPIHSVIAAQMWQAGTITDNYRGPIGSSAQRESPSYTYGISTPGRPVLSSGLTEETMRNALGDLKPDDLKVQGRRGGHSIVMDDGDLDGNDVLMRLRTSTGHQILLSDDGAAIHIIHANGQTWIELGNEGTIDIYAANSINLRSQGELNLHADKNVNIHAGENFNVYSGDNFKIESEKTLDLIGKKGLKGYSKSDVELLSDKSIKTHSKQKTSIHSEQKLNLDGSRIDLNTSTGSNVSKPKLITQNKLDDTYFEEPYGWESKTKELKTIVTRAPTHEPYSGHNKGVPIKIETQNSNSTSSTTKSYDKIEEISELSITNPITPSEVVKQIQQSNDVRSIGSCSQEQVGAILAQTAKDVDQNLNDITSKGIGKFGLPFHSLETLGVIKPGMVLLDQLTPDNVSESLSDSSIFTGKLGINSVDDILSSESVQSTMMQDYFSISIDELSADNITSTDANSLDHGSILGAATKATSMNELKQWASGSNNSSEMNNASRNGLFAASMAITTGSALLGVALSKSSSVGKDLGDITKQVGTVNRKIVDKATNDLVGNTKIPSMNKNSVNVQNQIKLDSGQVLGVTNAVGNIVDKDGNVIASDISKSTLIYPTADKELSNLPTTASNVYSNYSNTALDAFGNITDTSGNLIGRFNLKSDQTSIESTVVAAGSAVKGGTTGVEISPGGVSISPAPGPGIGSVKNAIDLNTYEHVLHACGVVRGSDEYYKKLYNHALTTGLTVSEVSKKLGISEQSIISWAESNGLSKLSGTSNYSTKTEKTIIDNASVDITSGKKKTSSAAGAYDITAYAQTLNTQGLSKDKFARLMLAKMKQTGLSPKQVDTQMGWPAGTTSNYIQQSENGKKDIFT